MLIDSHCHLDVAEFDHDREQVLQAARAHNVLGILVPAIDRASWSRIAALAKADEHIFPAYGLHPMFLEQHSDEDIDALDAWMAGHPPAAIGECGLDFLVDGLDRQRQLDVLRPQLRLARALNRPLILHGRRAFEPLLIEVQKVGGLRGIVHSFSGSAEQARQWCAAGFMLGFGGPVTYPRATRLRQVVATVPLQHLLIETDAPDQPLFGHQGERNEPMRLMAVRDCVATLRGIDPSELDRATTENFKRMWNA